MIRQRWIDELENCCGPAQRPPLKRTGIDKELRAEEDLDEAATRFARTLNELEKVK